MVDDAGAITPPEIAGGARPGWVGCGPASPSSGGPSVRTRLAATVCVVIAVTALGGPAAHAAPERYGEYYGHFDVGPAKIPYFSTRWVPQGLTKMGEDVLVASYYDRLDTLNSIVVLIDRRTGARIRTYFLDVRGHVGGLAMTATHLWVANDGQLRRYLRTDLALPHLSTITAGYVKAVAASSYASADGSSIWVGHFNQDHRDWMYRYTLTAGNTLSPTWVERVFTPSKVQGVALTRSRIVWSQSYGRNNDSMLIVWPRGTGYNGSSAIGNFVTAPNMSEGLVIAGGELQILFESCSDAYDGTADGNAADYIACTIHHGAIPPVP